MSMQPGNSTRNGAKGVRNVGSRTTTLALPDIQAARLFLLKESGAAFREWLGSGERK